MGRERGREGEVLRLSRDQGEKLQCAANIYLQWTK